MYDNITNGDITSAINRFEDATTALENALDAEGTERDALIEDAADMLKLDLRGADISDTISALKEAVDLLDNAQASEGDEREDYLEDAHDILDRLTGDEGE